MEKNNPRSGSNFDDFLKAQGMFDEVTAQALKRAIAEQLIKEILHVTRLSPKPHVCHYRQHKPSKP